VEIDANNPGVWMFHCHIEHHMANGMMTTLQYAGAMPAMNVASSAPANATTTAPLVSADDPSVAAAATKITLVDNRFQPSTVSAPAGSKVAFVNRGANVHTVSALDGSFESGSIPPGKAFVVTLSKPGTYQFLCRQHFLNGMSGSIAVQ
jgi:plastocyanin